VIGRYAHDHFDRRERLRGAGRLSRHHVYFPRGSRPALRRTVRAAPARRASAGSARAPRSRLLADGIRGAVLRQSAPPRLSVPGSGTISASAPPSFTAGVHVYRHLSLQVFVELVGEVQKFAAFPPGLSALSDSHLSGESSVVGRFVRARSQRLRPALHDVAHSSWICWTRETVPRHGVTLLLSAGQLTPQGNPGPGAPRCAALHCGSFSPQHTATWSISVNHEL